MGGPRRKRIIEDVVADLGSLPDERLEQARDFVEFIRQWEGQPERSSARALLRLFGTWEGPPGELDRLGDEIYEARDRGE